MSENYDPTSVDAVLAKILANQEAMRDDLRHALQVQEKHGQAIENLDRFKWYLMGASALLAIGFQHLKEWFGHGTK